jgi:hypothetical protein
MMYSTQSEERWHDGSPTQSVNIRPSPASSRRSFLHARRIFSGAGWCTQSYPQIRDLIHLNESNTVCRLGDAYTLLQIGWSVVIFEEARRE